MKVFKIRQLFLMSFTLLFLSACGGGSGTVVDIETVKEKAIHKIVDFAKTGQGVPTISDYESAGVRGVNADNIDKINDVISTITYTDVDTTAEIQAIADSLGVQVPIETPKDTQKPIITLLGVNPVTLNVDDTYIEFGATAMDDVDGNITSKINISSIPDTSKEGNYTVTYIVADLAGNVASVKRTVEVKSYPVAKDTHINEILASNAYTNVDADYSKFYDWIELYNDENHTVDVGGFYLSDKVSEPTKWQIPTGVRIAAKGYLLIWADNKDKQQKTLHTNFKLSSKGESVIFSDRDGNMIDTITFDKQMSDISCAKSGENIVFMKPTPAAKNSEYLTQLQRSEKPVFSLDGGFYTTAQTLTLSAAEGATVYFTTDGSTPTKNSLITQPITIDKTMVVRAKAFENGKFLSEMETKTYLFNHDSNLSVVSLSTDPSYLFDDMIGIYVDGSNGIALAGCGHNDEEKHNFAQDWERPVHIEFFDENKTEKFSDELLFGISGQCSRFFPKKSFKFEFDKSYGSKSLKETTYKLYETKSLEEIKDFKIRSGNKGHEIGDILATALVVDGNLSVDYQAYRTIQMFMNGEYWGVYNIREKKGADYIISNYPDIDKDNLDIINNYGPEVKSGDYDDYRELGIFASAKNIQEVAKRVDEDSLIDYMIVMIYSGNHDWIWSNSRAWKRKDADAKWRWMLDDLDAGFYAGVINQDNFAILTQKPSILANTFMTLLEDATFKAKFKEKFNTLLETLFSPANMRQRIDKILDERRTYITTGRWATNQTTFDNYVQSLYDFADQRSAVVKTQLDAL